MEKLKEYIDEANIYVEQTKQSRNRLNELLLNNADEKEVLLEQFFLARVNTDATNTFVKISHLIHFSKVFNVELDLTPLAEVNGLLEFISNHKPFETEFTIDPEGNLKDKNEKDTEQKFEFFKQQLKFSENFLNNATRNEEPS